MAVQYHIVYLSPNGSTRLVAQALAQGVSTGVPSASVSLADLSDGTPGALEAPAGIPACLHRDTEACLFIGSPVYFNRAVPPVMDFLERLPPTEGNWAVPFVTYGKACSGLALWQMASALQGKGYRIGGAAKVQAVHSLMWESEDPVGGGHPDPDELNQMRAFAETLSRRVGEGTHGELALQLLDYHPEELTEELRSKLSNPWPIMPKAVHGDACSECGICADECPVQAISLSPLPEFGEDCIDCFNCVRLCPEEAIVSETSLAEIGDMVQKRVRTVNEAPLSEAFIPLPS